MISVVETNTKKVIYSEQMSCDYYSFYDEFHHLPTDEFKTYIYDLLYENRTKPPKY